MPDLPIHVDAHASLQTFHAGTYEQRLDGLTVWKLAADLDRYAAILAATQPDVVIETGTKWGGSALWFERQGVDVITIDIDDKSSRRARQVCARTTWVVGDSVDPIVVERVAQMVAGRRAMVSLDAEHAAPHVAAEISAYGPLVTPGCYLVVEDGIFDLADEVEMKRRGGLSIPNVGGPLKAIQSTLATDPGWLRDEDIERMHLVSHHPAGWWVRRG